MAIIDSLDVAGIVFSYFTSQTEKFSFIDAPQHRDELMEKQVISKERVADHGEVYTRAQEVNAMLDLVKQETERIESRFLEPACGTGNFLVEILARKLNVVESRYRKSQPDYERNAVVAVSSIYGIDILEDNVRECRKRLFEVFEKKYDRLFKDAASERYRTAICHILIRNIIHGDALTMQTVEDKSQPIVFTEWSLVSNGMLKRWDYQFSYLLDQRRQLSLFNDENEQVNINTPVKEYPLIHFLDIGNDTK